MDLDFINKYCDGCRNKKTCKSPCRPVDEYINQDSKRAFIEKHFPKMIVTFPTSAPGARAGEFRGCDLHDKSFSEDGYVTNKPFDVNQVVDTVPDDFDDFPKLERQLQSKVFYKVFFERKDYETVALELDIKESDVSKMYFVAKKAIIKIVEYLDARKAASRFMSHSKLQKEQVWFILVNVFGLSAKDICELWPTKVGVEWVQRNVRNVKNEYLAGVAAQA
jgi:hypothetical protein